MKKNNFDPKCKKLIIACISFLGILLFTVVLIGIKSDKEKKMDENLIGYTLKSEHLIDKANLVNVEGFYLGKGILNGNNRYIFQVEKDKEVSRNIEVTDKEIELNYVPKDAISEHKPGTIEAYSRVYEKKDKKGKSKTRNIYFYKVYIAQNTIKDCGTLVDSSSESEE